MDEIAAFSEPSLNHFHVNSELNEPFFKSVFHLCSIRG